MMKNRQQDGCREVLKLKIAIVTGASSGMGREFVLQIPRLYKNLDELKDHYRRGGLGDVKVKKFLNAVMQEELAPIRARRKEWEQKLPEVFEILKEGSRVAEAKAAETLKDVKVAMRINYFDDEDFLN